MINNLTLVLQLSMRDIKNKFYGSFFGIMWNFILPLITILTFIFVFDYGFKTRPEDGSNFTLWLISAQIPWFFISESLISGTNSIFSYQFLIKKMNFKKELIPIISIFSSFLIHIVFVFFLITTAAFYEGFKFDYFQVFFLSSIIFLISTSISYFTSAVSVFIPDMKQLVVVIAQILFWLTPIFWQIEMFPKEAQNYLMINPYLHIVEGYRDVLTRNKFILLDGNLWSIVLIFSILMIFTYTVFNKLKNKFNDAI